MNNITTRENKHSIKVIKSQSAFEAKLQNNYRKDFGIYLTNNIETIDDILNIIDFEDKKVLSKKFIEPSCGNGVFIIRLLEKIIEKNNNAIEISKFIESNIYFVDIDETMIQKTKDNIRQFFINHFNEPFNGKFNCYILDYTQKITSFQGELFSEQHQVSPLVEMLDDIDYVIGNPPYVSLYGRRDKKKNEAQRIYYLNNYSQFPTTLKNGKINYVMLFIEQSINLLKNGGKLSFIIDLAFFETAYLYTRKYLLDNTTIISIEYNVKDFEVASGQIILKLTKKKSINNIVKIINSETCETVEVAQSEWNNPKDQYKFRFNICSLSSEIIKKIHNQEHKTLKQLYPKKNLRTCVMLLNMENLFVFETPNNDKNVNIYPYYQGSKGLNGKFQLMKHSKYFHYDKNLQNKINTELKYELTAKGIKNKKRLGLGETIIYDNPKVYIRQSAKEIIASYDENPSSANNSLYVFSLRGNSERDRTFLKFLCGLLNSDLITFYAQQMNIIRYSKGKQPQIKTSDLYQIPVPEGIALQEDIATLYDMINFNNERDIINNEIVIKKINDYFYSYFEISESEIKIIKKSISVY